MICSVVGARPNFIKMAPVMLEAMRRGLPHFSVHTGQHYDEKMSKVFFDELHMPQPDVFLGAGSGSHAEQTARIMSAFEPVCLERKPSLVIVAGDVNSTIACALVAAKLGIPVAHLEAGLRSFDRTMPEEINRVLTDHLADLLLTSEPDGAVNLRREGIAEDKIFFVGNCMIDSLETHRAAALSREPWQQFGLTAQNYGLVTLHRPAAVDDPEKLEELRGALEHIAQKLPLLFPVHPRTRSRIEVAQSEGCNWQFVQLVEPQGYLDFLGLMAGARLVLTDSGGVQEETTALRVPCITLRENTERPVTVTQGTNRLAGLERGRIISAAEDVLNNAQVGQVPENWDGRAAVRTLDVIERWLQKRTSHL
jgi:UDP-N-acetylglucosamine 2-epimerase (non-hydrolysing)